MKVRKERAGNRTPIEYCIVMNDNAETFVIRADEIAVYCHWEAARRGERHFPRDFEPYRVRDLENLRFTGWREEENAK